jgi:hypothetical protein
VIAEGGEMVLFRGSGGVLWVLPRRANGQWAGPLKVSKLRMLQSPPFAATGSSGAPLDVFWIGEGGMLWTGGKTSRYGEWLGPVDLGGQAS